MDSIEYEVEHRNGHGVTKTTNTFEDYQIWDAMECIKKFLSELHHIGYTVYVDNDYVKNKFGCSFIVDINNIYFTIHINNRNTLKNKMVIFVRNKIISNTLYPTNELQLKMFIQHINHVAYMYNNIKNTDFLYADDVISIFYINSIKYWVKYHTTYTSPHLHYTLHSDFESDIFTSTSISTILKTVDTHSSKINLKYPILTGIILNISSQFKYVLKNENGKYFVSLYADSITIDEIGNISIKRDIYSTRYIDVLQRIIQSSTNVNKFIKV